MEFNIYRLIIFLLSIGVIGERTIRFVRREERQTAFKYIAVVFIWSCVAVFSLFPSLAHSINKMLGFGDNFNTLIFLGFFVVFYLIFRMLSVIEHIETILTELIRKDALRDLKSNIKIRKRK